MPVDGLCITCTDSSLSPPSIGNDIIVKLTLWSDTFNLACLLDVTNLHTVHRGGTEVRLTEVALASSALFSIVQPSKTSSPQVRGSCNGCVVLMATVNL